MLSRNYQFIYGFVKK